MNVCVPRGLREEELPLYAVRGHAVEELTVPRGSVYVLGDCADVSVDSRVWGPLRTSEIRARPLNTLKGRR